MMVEFRVTIEAVSDADLDDILAAIDGIEGVVDYERADD